MTYEYRREDASDCDVHYVNDLAKLGWRLVFICDGLFWFERVKVNKPPITRPAQGEVYE